MTHQSIHIDELLPYIAAALDGDEEILEYFDRSVEVQTTLECAEAIEKKIRDNYPDATIKGVLLNDEKVGFYVHESDILISFGLKPSCRVKVWLVAFWQFIQQEFNGPFQCVLYSYNTRAIEWLQKCGMTMLFENISILQLCPQQQQQVV